MFTVPLGLLTLSRVLHFLCAERFFMYVLLAGTAAVGFFYGVCTLLGSSGYYMSLPLRSSLCPRTVACEVWVRTFGWGKGLRSMGFRVIKGRIGSIRLGSALSLDMGFLVFGV